LSDKDYTYKTLTEKTLESFKEEAEREGYFQELSNEYAVLLDKMLLNKNNDLKKSKEDIKQILTMEIMSRYYYQKGRIKASIKFDKEVEKAIEILQNIEKYNNILSKK